MKKCLGCGINKDLTDYGKDKDRKNGHRERCKACMRPYQVAYAKAKRDAIRGGPWTGKITKYKPCPVCKMVLALNGITQHARSAACWGESVPILNEETRAAWKYWQHKRCTPNRNKSVKFLLTPTELLQLLSEAGITANDIGHKSHQYALGRYGDTGNYEVGNCRFITVRQNSQERDSTNCGGHNIKRKHAK